MSFHNSISVILNNIETDFKKGELAYLAMTSKIENPLRDRIAFALHTQFGDKYFICREWNKGGEKSNRTDIAIIDRKTEDVKCLIELKANTTPRKEDSRSIELAEDFRKMSRVAKDDTELYFVSFNNLIQTSKVIDLKLGHSIKYHSDINRVLSKTNPSELRDKIISYWETYLIASSLDLKKYETIEIGVRSNDEYYDLPLTVLTFLYGPVFKSDLTHLKLDGYKQ